MSWRVPLSSIVLATMCACGNDISFPEPPTDMLESERAIAEGARLYARDCAICHGTEGHGDGPQAWSLRPAPSSFHHFTGVRADSGYWFFRIKEGGHAAPLARAGSAMPSWGDHLTDEQIWQLVAHINSFVNKQSSLPPNGGEGLSSPSPPGRGRGLG